MNAQIIEKKFKIITIQSLDNRIIIQLSPKEQTSNQVMKLPKTPRLEDIILKEPETEEERMAMRIARGYMKELQKYMPSSHSNPSPRYLSIELTTEEYENLGKPTINEEIILKLEYS